jgi:tetratricopeptide (TPR) repeat protein
MTLFPGRDDWNHARLDAGLATTSHDDMHAGELAQGDPAEFRRAATARMLDHYLHTADAADRLLIPTQRRVPLEPPVPGAAPQSFGTQAEALAWCEAERPNLTAAVRHAAAAGLPALAWRLPVVMWGFFMLRKHWTDWFATGNVALTAARRSADRAGQAWAGHVLGIAYWDTWQFTRADPYLREALDIWLGEGDRWGEGSVLATLAALHRDTGRLPQAAADYVRALGLYREAGDTWGEAIVLAGLGATQRDLSRLDEAVVHPGDAVAIFRRLGDRWGEGLATENLGITYLAMQRLPDAVSALREAVRLRQAIGDRWGEGTALRGLGAALRRSGWPDAARDVWRRALELLESFHDPQAEDVQDELAKLG